MTLWGESAPGGFFVPMPNLEPEFLYERRWESVTIHPREGAVVWRQSFAATSREESQ
jgi:hypothetical protein